MWQVHYENAAAAEGNKPGVGLRVHDALALLLLFSKQRVQKQKPLVLVARHHSEVDRFGFSGNVKALQLPVICNRSSTAALL